MNRNLTQLNNILVSSLYLCIFQMLEWIQDYLPFILQIIVLINNNRRQNYSLNKQEINTVRESLNIWNAQPQYVPVHSIASLKHLIRGVFPLLPLCPVVSTRLWCFFFTVFFCDLHKHKKGLFSASCRTSESVHLQQNTESVGLVIWAVLEM